MARQPSYVYLKDFLEAFRATGTVDGGYSNLAARIWIVRRNLISLTRVVNYQFKGIKLCHQSANAVLSGLEPHGQSHALRVSEALIVKSWQALPQLQPMAQTSWNGIR
jgi:hypothetical protein